MRREAIQCVLVGLGAAVALPACGASDAELRRARTSGFATDFAVVYSETLIATRELYPSLDEDARTGVIRTAWHPVKFGSGSEDPTSQPTMNVAGAGTNPQQLGTTTSVHRTTYFIRFAVFVVGGKPWRVRVEGEASLWRAGEVPVPLHGADVPPWLAAREDSLRLAIFNRLERYAVALKFTTASERPAKVARHHAGFKDLPAAAIPVLTAVREAAQARDAGRLRGHMADAFEWTAGGEPSADVALATFQADPDILGELFHALETGCAARGAPPNEIVCPAAATEPSFVGRRARFARPAGAWKLVSLISVE